MHRHHEDNHYRGASESSFSTVFRVRESGVEEGQWLGGGWVGGVEWGGGGGCGWRFKRRDSGWGVGGWGGVGWWWLWVAL